MSTIRDQHSAMKCVLIEKEEEVTSLGKQFRNAQGVVDALKV